MGVFGGIEDKASSFDANYVRAGTYITRIGGAYLRKNRTGEQNFIIEHTVLHVLDDDDGRGHKVGEEISHVIPNHGGGKDMFLPNVKHFVKKTIGCTEEEVTEEIVEGVVDEGEEGKDGERKGGQPFAGLVVEWTGRGILTKKEKPFTRVTYVGQVTLEERLERGLITEDDFKELTAAEDE